MNEFLTIPAFHRLADWFGVWLMEPQAAQGLHDLILHYGQTGYLQNHIKSALAQPVPRDIPLQLVDGKGKNKIAVVSITGTMMKGQSSFGGTSTIAARQAIRQAAADPNVSGILLAIDSPGGSSAGTADLAADVKAAARQKPVWVQIEDQAASAAYWVVSQADQVFVNATTALIGNIGTYIVIEDSSAANEKNGVREIAFASGPLKVFGGGLGVNDDQAKMMQGIVDAIQEQFAQAVRSGRGLNDSRMKEVSSGAIYPANQALKLGLIDGVQSMDITIEKLSRAK